MFWLMLFRMKVTCDMSTWIVGKDRCISVCKRFFLMHQAGGCILHFLQQLASSPVISKDVVWSEDTAHKTHTAKAA